MKKLYIEGFTNQMFYEDEQIVSVKLKMLNDRIAYERFITVGDFLRVFGLKTKDPYKEEQIIRGEWLLTHEQSNLFSIPVKKIVTFKMEF